MPFLFFPLFPIKAINYGVAALVRRAFKMYATGEYSDADIATWMSKCQPIQHVLRSGRKPVDKEMVREMLQNRTYAGYVSHRILSTTGLLERAKNRVVINALSLISCSTSAN